MDNNEPINRTFGIAAALIILGVLSILLVFAAGCSPKTPFDLSSVPGPPTESYSSPGIIRPPGLR